MKYHLYKFISKIKGNNYNLDTRIPLSYIVRKKIIKILQRVYAVVRLRRLTKAYVDVSTTIFAPNMLKYSNNLKVGKNCYISALGTEGIVCGENVTFGLYTTMIVSDGFQPLGKGIKLGNNVGLGSHGFYGGAGGVEVGDDTIFGNYVSVHPENHNYDNIDKPIRHQGVNHKGIKIGKGCWIGAKVTILDGAEIDDGCVVAAGAVVRGKFPKNSIIGGVPAKIIKMR